MIINDAKPPPTIPAGAPLLIEASGDRGRLSGPRHIKMLRLAQIADSTLKGILNVLHARAQHFWASTLSTERHRQEVVVAHRAVIEALMRQDAAAAEAAMEARIQPSIPPFRHSATRSVTPFSRASRLKHRGGLPHSQPPRFS